MMMIASEVPNVFRSYEVWSAVAERNALGSHGKLDINPLYHVERIGDKLRLRLRFPSKHYELEFGPSARRYLPEELELEARELDRPDLIAKRIVLCLPDNY